MPDQRSVMKEFRFLDEKRSAGGLSPAEELRYAELRDLVAPDVGTGGARPGFDVDAAAARLRESLLPAGLRNRPPPTPLAAPEPEPITPEPLSAADALASAFESEPFAPLDAPAEPEGFFDPASLGDVAGDTAWDPNAQPYDAAAQAWDPNAQPYDAAAQAWDPDAQPYDAAAQAWDPNAQPYDAAAQAWDPNAQPYDAAPPAWDPNAPPYDAAAPAWDPNAPPYDAAPPAWDPNAPPYDAAAPAWDVRAEPADAAVEAWNPSAEPPDEAPAERSEAASPGAPGVSPLDATELWGAAASEGEVQEVTLLDGATAGAGEAPQPWDAAAALCEATPVHPLEGAPDEGAELAADPAPGAISPWPPGADDLGLDGSGPTGAEGTAWAELPPPAAGTPELGLDAGEGALEDDLAAGGTPSFDAAAEPLAEGALAPLAEGEFLSDEEPEATYAPAPHADPGALPPDGWDVEPPGPSAPAAPAFGEYDEAGAGAARFDPALELGLEEAPGAEAQSFASDLPPEALLGFGATTGEYDDTEGFANPFADPAPPELASDGSGYRAARAVLAPEGGGWDPGLELEASPADDGFALESSGSFDAPAPADDLPLELDLDGAALSLEAAASGRADEEDIPILDGEDILEEIVEEVELTDELPAALAAAPAEAGPADPPAPEPVPLAPPFEEEPSAAPAEEAPPASPGPAAGRLAGSHRVIVHTLDGQVRRGTLEDPDLAAATLPVVLQPGAAPEWLETETVKAIFFMLPPGERPPPPDGRRVRVTFADGRQVAGFSPDYREDGEGFFMIPADTRTSTARIWVYRAAARQVTVS